MKKYYITETQYSKLIENKKNKEIANNILEEIKITKSKLNESTLLNEAVIDTLKKYAKRGLLTVGVITTLLANNVSAQDLASAGVPQNTIKVAMEQTNQKVNPQAVERAIIQNLRAAGEEGTLKQFQSLDQQRKTNVINSIANQLKGDIGKIADMDLSLYLNRGTELKGDQFSKIGEHKTISVDTVYVDLVKDYATEFEFNSNNLENPQQVQKEFQEFLNSFHTVNKITIVSSSSTLRNTGNFEGKTWQESSQLRVDVLKQLLVGMEYNLGGCGANETNQITEDMIEQNINGTNGDGTSGPKSPFEVDQRMIQSYGERGVDASLWQSAAKDAPLVDVEELKTNNDLIDQYKQFQYVKIVISGSMVETNTNEIINYDYVKMTLKKHFGSSIQKNPEKGKEQGVKVLSCPMK